MQGYNAQVAVEATLQLIVGQAVTQATNDKQQLEPMVTTIQAQAGETPDQLLADSGYCSDANLAALAATLIDAYLATRKTKHGDPPRPCPRGRIPQDATRVQRMARKLLTKTGAAIYATRKGIVEPVFGQIKHVRGFRRFHLRGLEKGPRGVGVRVCDAQCAEDVPSLRGMTRQRRRIRGAASP